MPCDYYTMRLSQDCKTTTVLYEYLHQLLHLFFSAVHYHQFCPQKHAFPTSHSKNEDLNYLKKNMNPCMVLAGPPNRRDSRLTSFDLRTIILIHMPILATFSRPVDIGQIETRSPEIRKKSKSVEQIVNH